MSSDRYARVFDAGATTFHSLSSWLWDPISVAAADVLACTRGDRVLDLCCGTGASAVPLARAVGPDGHVDAVDHAPALVDIGRRCAAEQGLSHLTFHHADVTRWRRPGDRYDALACVLGAFFLPDRDLTMGRLLADNLRPGGRAVVTVWAEQGVQPLGRLLWDAVGRRDPSRTASPPSPGARLETAAALLEFADAIGLVAPKVISRPAVVTLDSGRARALCVGTGFGALLEGLSQTDLDGVRADVDQGLAGQGWQLDVSVRHLVGGFA